MFVLPASAFSYDRNSRTFVIEASDLRAYPNATGNLAIKGNKFTVEFVSNDADMYENEFYDGEMSTFISLGLADPVNLTIIND